MRVCCDRRRCPSAKTARKSNNEVFSQKNSSKIEVVQTGVAAHARFWKRCKRNRNRNRKLAQNRRPIANNNSTLCGNRRFTQTAKRNRDRSEPLSAPRSRRTQQQHRVRLKNGTFQTSVTQFYPNPTQLNSIYPNPTQPNSTQWKSAFGEYLWQPFAFALLRIYGWVFCTRIRSCAPSVDPNPEQTWFEKNQVRGIAVSFLNVRITVVPKFLNLAWFPN